MPISCHFTYSLNQIRKIVVALPSKLGTRFWDFIIRLHNRTSWAHERVMWSTLTMVTGQSVACTAYHTMAYNRLRYVRRQQVRAQRHQWPRERPTDRRADENRQPHPVTPWRHSRPVYSKATAGYTGPARPGTTQRDIWLPAEWPVMSKSWPVYSQQPQLITFSLSLPAHYTVHRASLYIIAQLALYYRQNSMLCMLYGTSQLYCTADRPTDREIVYNRPHNGLTHLWNKDFGWCQ